MNGEIVDSVQQLDSPPARVDPTLLSETEKKLRQMKNKKLLQSMISEFLDEVYEEAI